ncbi:MAG TPA: hypothetical protein VJU78_02070 [Chitinophagaceae bacterium]|nr:hypothetical protein [Chitinophagaceae bacterium]
MKTMPDLIFRCFLISGPKQMLRETDAAIIQKFVTLGSRKKDKKYPEMKVTEFFSQEKDSLGVVILLDYEILAPNGYSIAVSLIR